MKVKKNQADIAGLVYWTLITSYIAHNIMEKAHNIQTDKQTDGRTNAT